MPKQCLLVLLDGLGDRSHAELDGRTPLQAARTPCLDSLAKAGGNGLYHSLMAGVAMPSELAHWLLWGYPQALFPGRGAIEALGEGLDLGPEDVAVMARLVHVRQEDGRLRLMEDTPALPDPEDAVRLAQALPDMTSQGMDLAYCHIKGLHGLLLMRPNGSHPSPLVTDTNPIRDKAWLIEPTPLAEARQDANAVASAAALKEYLVRAHKILREHPVNKDRTRRGLPPINGLATQRPGQRTAAVPFAQRYGLKGAVIASGALYGGLGLLLGMEWIRVQDTDDPGADLAQRLDMARHALKEFDFVHVHTKTPDVAAHTKDCGNKVAVIESLDKGMATILPDLARDPDLLLAVTADHSTPSSGTLIHSGEPVPLLLHGRGVRRDEVKRFDEVSAAGGALGFLRGPELMLTLLDLLDRSRLLGLRDCPEPFDDIPAWPGQYEPFRLP